MPYLPNADLIVNRLSSLMQLMFSENRVKAEIYDHLLSYSFYRSYLFLYVLFLWSCFECSSVRPVLSAMHLALYQWLLFVASAVIMTYCKLKQKLA